MRFRILAGVGLVVFALSLGSLWLASRDDGPMSTGRAAEDYSARFAGYEAAPEPNGDLSKVVWPDYVLAAGPEVQRLYSFHVTHGELMRYMPCFCGCHLEDGHRSNRDCYVERVNADGSVVFDPMAPT